MPVNAFSDNVEQYIAESTKQGGEVFLLTPLFWNFFWKNPISEVSNIP